MEKPEVFVQKTSHPILNGNLFNLFCYPSSEVETMDILMTIWLFLIGIVIGVIAGVALSFRQAISPLHQRIGKLTTEPGLTLEAMKYYPYNLQRFRFIGDPLDGIQFEDNKILFVQLSKKRTPEQNHIKKLVEEGNVEWFEFTTS
jgi:hypothetical protein